MFLDNPDCLTFDDPHDRPSSSQMPAQQSANSLPSSSSAIAAKPSYSSASSILREINDTLHPSSDQTNMSEYRH
jgi:hypothetical protein